MDPMARKAIRIFPRRNYTHRCAVNTLRRGWMRAIEYLGPRWLSHPARRMRGEYTVDAIVLLACVIALVIVLFA